MLLLHINNTELYFFENLQNQLDQLHQNSLLYFLIFFLTAYAHYF